MPPRRITQAVEPKFGAPVAKDVGTAAAPSQSLFWALGGFPSSTGVPVSPLTAIQVSTVYACVKARSEDLAKVPIKVRKRLRRGGWQEDTDHWSNRLLRRPNNWMTPFAWKRYVEMSLCYRGNAYVAIKRDNAGTPVALVPIIPDKVYVEVSNKGNPFYRLRDTLFGENVLLDQDNILHPRNGSIDSGYVGMSPIAASQEAIGLALAAQQHGAILFRQGAQINGVLTHPMTLSNEAKEWIARDFSQKYSGTQNSSKTPVLEEGMKFEPIQMTNADAQYLELRKFQRIDICGIFRVPPHKVMDLERATFSNIENQEQSYINDALMPDADQLVQEMNNKLLFGDEQGEYEFYFDWDSLLRGDRKTRYDAHAIGLNNGFLNVNEVRQEEGRSPVKGGDEYRVPLNLGAAGNPPDGVKPPATGTPGDAAPNPVPESEKQ